MQGPPVLACLFALVIAQSQVVPRETTKATLRQSTQARKATAAPVKKVKPTTTKRVTTKKPAPTTKRMTKVPTVRLSTTRKAVSTKAPSSAPVRPGAGAGAQVLSRSADTIVRTADTLNLTVPVPLRNASLAATGIASLYDAFDRLRAGQPSQQQQAAPTPSRAGRAVGAADTAVRVAEKLGVQLPDSVKAANAVASGAVAVVEDVNSLRKVATQVAAGSAPRVAMGVRSGAGLVTDAAAGVVRLADSAGVAVGQPLRDGVEVAGLVKSVNLKDTAINGVASIRAIASGDMTGMSNVRSDNNLGKNGLPAQMASYVGEVVSSGVNGRGAMNALRDGREALGDSALGRFGDALGEGAAKAEIGVRNWWNNRRQ